MTRINQIVSAAAKAGLADWDELIAIVAAVEAMHNECFKSEETANEFKVRYGTVSFDALYTLNGEAE